MNEQECKYLRPEDQTCRLEGGKADLDRCAGCRWRKEERIMTKAHVMRMTNALLGAMESCWDEDLTDRVCAAVSGNEPFDEDEIAEAEKEE